MKGLFITGSGTNVGKTFIAKKLVELLDKTQTVRVRKPVESDCTPAINGLVPKDALLLSHSCREVEPLDRVCPFRFQACASAEKASADAGQRLALQQLHDACQVDSDADFVLIEGAGGLYSPVAADALNSDLAKALKLPLVLVVKDELGAVNQALLCLQAAEMQQLTVAMLVLNQIRPNALDNAKFIRQYSAAPVLEFSSNREARFLAEALTLIKQG